MKDIFFFNNHKFFSGKKFLGFVNEGEENSESEPELETSEKDEKKNEKIEEVKKTTKDRVNSVLEKSQEKKEEESDKQKIPEISEKKEEDVLKNVLDSHNSDRTQGDLNPTEKEPEEFKKQKIEESIGNFGVYKAEEKHILDFYKRENDDLAKYLYKINDLKKQNEILGAATKNLRQFKGESNIIRELRFRSLGKFEKTKEKINSFASKFLEFQSRFQDLEKEENDIVWQQKNAELIEELVSHVSSFQQSNEDSSSIIEDILTTKNDLKILIYDLIPDRRSADNFVSKYFEELDLAKEIFSKTLSNFLEILQDRDFDLSGTEKFWNSLPRAVRKLNQYIDFNNGVLKEDMAHSEERIGLQSEGLDFLEENGFFKEDGDTIFAENISQTQKEIEERIKNYSKKFNKARVKIYKDIEKLDEDEFFDKYSFPKEEIIKVLEAHDSNIQSFKEKIKTWEDERFINKWFKKYNESDGSRAEALVELGAFSEHKKGLVEIKNFEEGFDNFLDTSKSVTTYRFSLYDLYQMFKRYYEKRERLWQRRSERAVSQLGVDVFGADTPIGREFTKESEDEEHKRVEEIEGQKHSFYGWDVQRDLYKTNDPDEAKACIGLLIKKGFMKWDDPKFWKTLNTLEGFKRFSDSDINLTADQILSKVEEACTNIWSANDFKEWDNSLTSQAKSAQDNFKTEFDRYETMPGDTRSKILADMIKKKYQGENGADPARFEGFLRVAIEKAKMNGGPLYDQRMWFLVHGVASGLLSRDAFSRINDEFLAAYPLIDFFTDKDSWKKDGRVVPPGTPGAREGGPWMYEDYQSWAKMLGDNNGSFLPGGPESQAGENRARFMYDIIMGSETATGRAGRMVRGSAKNWDHDDMALYSGVINVADIETMIARESSGPERMTPDAWRTILYGYDSYFKAVVRQIDEGDMKYSQIPGWKDIREKKLKQAGEAMRSAIAITQTLSGNVDLFGSKRNTLFTKERWEKSTGMSISANESKEKINKMARIFFDNSNLSKEEKKQYKELLTFNALDKNMGYGEQVLSDGKKSDSLVKNIVKGGAGDAIFTQDTDQILKNLREYCQ